MNIVKNKIYNTILKGDSEDASYKEQELLEYTNNPYIEALPKIFTEDDIIDNFSVIPNINLEDKNKETHIRYHIIKRTKNFIQPLPVHFIVERRLSTLIRRGYLARNPLNKAYFKRMQLLNELKNNESFDLSQLNETAKEIRSTADSISIIGISGIGKTTAIERLLLMYPQLIHHSKYKNKIFTRTQIVWLKIDCPYDGNLSTLCKSFFKAIDDILGTRYLEKYGYLSRISSTMMLNMTTLATLYGIGVLVIDELQNLLNNSNRDEMLDFFVTLSNTVGIPTVLIGTSKAQQIFSGNFRQARRAGSDGSIMWDRMKKDSAEWEFFLESLWDLNCLKEKTPLTDEIKNAFYDECQGITSVAVNMFILAQERALSQEKEKLSITLIRETSKEDLGMIQPMIKALRTNDTKEIMKYEDISINLEQLSINYKKDIDLVGRLKEQFKDKENIIESNRKNTIENLVFDLTSLGIFPSLSNVDIKNLCKKIVDKEPIGTEYNTIKSLAIQEAIRLNETYNEKQVLKENKDKSILNEGLLAIYDIAIKKNKHPYELLLQNGYIKNAKDEFLHSI